MLSTAPGRLLSSHFKSEFIEDGDVWIDALMKRNLTVYTYNDEVAEKLLREIHELYFPQLKKLYEKLKREL
ncbi:nucleotidyltransferase substrate binding protein, HI0074 family [Dethiobacter alkaliphilus AHT 1]|uniref:Nucleotidyltransferase substrate binding protein, HI0074 family n=1 Tax=Dethiobacter alkaliphilus AHT 1 TaxID=555088 RepID=C0GGM4_DETAL|nr:nucleotidyltransferase substrate binding protein, HI0074 family [Dethiobacter alkaliphilus AHT 1]